MRNRETRPKPPEKKNPIEISLDCKTCQKHRRGMCEGRQHACKGRISEMPTIEFLALSILAVTINPLKWLLVFSLAGAGLVHHLFGVELTYWFRMMRYKRKKKPASGVYAGEPIEDER